ncbi:MAG: phosphoribulokinase, partial [Deltaproteobacteria bacterium]
MLAKQHIDDFISRHQLPNIFRHLIDEHYIPLTSWLIRQHHTNKPLFLGINGAQGTGKSTLADFLQLALEESVGWHVA